MKQVEQISREKAVNLDISSKCTLSCSGCDRQWYVKHNQKIPKNDLSFEDFVKIADYFERILFCGNISDPVFNPNFIRMLELCDQKNIQVQIHTSASHQPKEWYIKAFEANKNAKWIFGLDGLPKDSHKYRVNQDGNKLYEMMKLGVSMGIFVSWQYIVFDYNEDDSFEAYGMAVNENMEFLLVESSRFDDENPLKPETGFTLKQNLNTFDPACLKNKEYGWDFQGKLLPCCWYWQPGQQHLSFLPELTDDKFNIGNVKSVNDIINSKEWIDFHKMLKDNPENAPEICKTYCGRRGGKTSTRTFMNN